MKQQSTIMLLIATLLYSAHPGVSRGALVITEVMSNTDHPGGTANGDWWELTNTGPTSVDLQGYSWDDNEAMPGTSIFPAITIGADASLLVVDENDVNLPGFRAAWGLAPALQVVGPGSFTGTDPFSGLGSLGDMINVYDDNDQLVASVTFGDSELGGKTFEWARDGVSLGFSVVGENGAFVALNDGADGAGIDVGSPGITVATGGGPLIGDMDIDGDVDFDDIAGFVLGLNDPAAYQAMFGSPPVTHGDTDMNGSFDFDDITGFVSLLGATPVVDSAHAVPEPRTFALACLALISCYGKVRFRQARVRYGG
jgi:hypothetical protein